MKTFKIGTLIILVFSVLLLVFGVTTLSATEKPVLTPTPTPSPNITPTPTPNITPTLPPTIPPPTLPPPTPTAMPTPWPFCVYQKNVHAQNLTGQTANDLEVYLKGNVQVLSFLNKSPFNSLSYSYDFNTDMTTVRFYGGTVAPGEWVNSCLILNAPGVEIKQRTWTYNGEPISPVGATISTNFEIVNPDLVNITIGNYAQDGGSITITDFQYGSSNRIHTLGELLWSNDSLTEEIQWSPNQTFSLNLQASKTITSIPMLFPAVSMIYRIKAYLNSDPDNIIEYVEEFVSPRKSIKVQFYNQGTTATSNQIYLNFKLINTSTNPISLSNVKLRYYYTIDGVKPQNFYCDYSPVGSSNVTGSFVPMPVAATTADYCVEVGFTSGAGNLAAGASVTVQARVAKSDWSNYTQTNDYSFNSTATNYVDWTKVTVFLLHWGVQP